MTSTRNKKAEKQHNTRINIANKHTTTVTHLLRTHHNHPTLNSQARHIPAIYRVILVHPNISPVPWNLSAISDGGDDDDDDGDNDKLGL